MGVINHPKHYAGKVEAIDCIESAVEGLTGIDAVLTSQVIKYTFRWSRKGAPLQDLKKARWYLDRLIERATVAQLMAGGDLDAYDQVERFLIDRRAEEDRNG